MTRNERTLAALRAQKRRKERKAAWDPANGDPIVIPPWLDE